MAKREFGGVLSVGLATQDIVMSVPEIPNEPIKILANSVSYYGGGPAATAAVAIARLGGNVRLACRLGDDATGQAVLSELKSEGVDTNSTRLVSGYSTPTSVILVDAVGERLIVAHSDPKMPSDASWLKETSADAVLCDLTWPEGATVALEAARGANKPGVLDIEVSRHAKDTVERLVNLCSHAVFSRSGLQFYTGSNDIAEGLKMAQRTGHKLTAVTYGEKGVFWLQDDGLQVAKPPEVDVLDTVGAGDAFHGALAFALSLGWSLENAISLSNLVAAMNCRKPGGRLGLPTASSISEFDPRLGALLQSADLRLSD